MRREPLSAPASQRFPFAQLDFAGSLGLPEGRFLLRQPSDAGTPQGEPIERVLVIQTPVAPQKPRRRSARRPGREAELPSELPLSRVTAVFAERAFASEEEAASWMRATAADEAELGETLIAACRMLNRALQAMAVAAADPYLGERLPSQAVAARIGHGLGQELADGRFSEALATPTRRSKRRRRSDEVAPQERMAGLLSGRETADLCETFLLRARADFNGGRLREAAIGLGLSLNLLLGELSGALADPDHELDLNLLESHRLDLEAAAKTARSGPLSAAEAERVADLLAVRERVLRRRRILRG